MLIPSLYAATTLPGRIYPALDGDCSASVVVVGAGFTGLSAALHLREAGVSVAVLETHDPGWGASGRNGGQVNPGIKHDPDEIETTFGSERGRRLVDLTFNAPTYTFSLIERLAIDCDADNSGTLRVALTESEAATIRAAADYWRGRGGPVEALDAAQLAALIGTSRYCFGLLDRRGGSVNPLAYARGLAAAVTTAGARVFSASPALALERYGDCWIAVTPGGKVSADRVVVGTNGYTGPLWPGLMRSIIPVYSAIAATAPLSGALQASILPGRQVVYEDAPRTLYYRVDRHGRLLFGGRSRLKDTANQRDFRDLMAHATSLFPQMRGVEWTHFWNGQVAITRDRYPHLHEPIKGVHIGLGYSGRGIAMATVMGRLIAQRILHPERESELPVTSVVAIPMHSLWKPLVKLRFAYQTLRSWVKA